MTSSALRQGTKISQSRQITPINFNGNVSENDESHLVNMSKDNSTSVLQKKITSIEAAKMQMSLHLIKSLWKIIDKFATSSLESILCIYKEN